ncbi:cyd operon YbgE family protein [Labrys monachus]|uniref:Membrane protein n=1 Tax=Labrys monachus TaxID=217067 RepID=A0ABU0FFC6_9HYPH|nr:cyd operon YbgE family protein [Labrys monachus]MDQ0393305.1 putative membrane protein [Labrys monachus]
MTEGFDLASAARSLARGFSLAIAGAVSLLLLVYPYILAGIPAWSVHAGLPLMMSGAAGLFMHGLGFEPRNGVLRVVFHPASAWLLFLGGLAVLVGVR